MEVCSGPAVRAQPQLGLHIWGHPCVEMPHAVPSPHRVGGSWHPPMRAQPLAALLRHLWSMIRAASKSAGL